MRTIILYDSPFWQFIRIDLTFFCFIRHLQIQNRNYSLNYEGLDLFADPTSFEQEKLETGPTEFNDNKIFGLEQSTIILIAVVVCGTLGLIIVVASVCYFVSIW